MAVLKIFALGATYHGSNQFTLYHSEADEKTYRIGLYKKFNRSPPPHQHNALYHQQVLSDLVVLKFFIHINMTRTKNYSCSAQLYKFDMLSMTVFRSLHLQKMLTLAYFSHQNRISNHQNENMLHLTYMQLQVYK